MDATIKQQRRPACDVCGKFFTRPVDVQRHTRNVHGKQKHECSLCGLKYTHAHGLKNHIASVHEAKRFRCGMCDRSFSYSTSLRRHLTKSHPGDRSAILKNSDAVVIAPTEDVLLIAAPDFPTAPTGVMEQLPPVIYSESEVVAPTEDVLLIAAPDFPTVPTSVMEQLPPVIDSQSEVVAPTPVAVPDAVSPAFSVSPHMLVVEQILPATNIDDSVIPPTTDIPDTGAVPVSPNSAVEQSLAASSSDDPSRKHVPYGAKAKKTKCVSELAALQDLPPDVKKLYTENWATIRTHTSLGLYMSTYTFFHRPLGERMPDWASLLKPIIDTRTQCFKINFSHHFILRHQETQALRFYHASVNNNTVLDMPTRICSKQDFDRFIDIVADSQSFDFAHYNRPSTKWTVESIPATSFYLYNMDFCIV